MLLATTTHNGEAFPVPKERAYGEHAGQTELSNGFNTVLIDFQTRFLQPSYSIFLKRLSSDFEEYPGPLMIERRASADHGVGKMGGKDGSDNQPEWIFVIGNLSRKGGHQWPETALGRVWSFYSLHRYFKKRMPKPDLTRIFQILCYFNG